MKLDFDKTTDRDRNSYGYLMAKTIADHAADDHDLAVTLAVNQVKGHIKKVERPDGGGIRVYFTDGSFYQMLYDGDLWKSQAGWAE